MLNITYFFVEVTIHYNPNNNECLCSTRSILHSENTTTVYSGKANPQDFQLQSGRETFSIANNSTGSQNVSYTSAAPGYVASVSDAVISPDAMTVTEASNSISDFLSRPVQIAQFTITVGGSINGFSPVVLPWNDFLNTPTVKKKIENFRLLRGNMHLKFELNASPFQYGKIMVTYDPYEAASIQDIPRIDLTTDCSLVIPSQRMKVFLNPATSQGAEMLLPFFYEDEYFDLVSLPAVLGTIRFWSLQPFSAMNGATDSLSLKVYAHMTNVTLCMPTFFPQSGYESGMVGRTATAIASAASVLTNIPYIGRYARATEYGASMMAKVANLFGFSKPTIVADETRMVPFVASNTATGNGVDSAMKLAMDAKNELSIDPGIVGLNSKDELAIANIAGIESYFFSFPWTGAPTGTCLASMLVTPVHYRVPQGEGIRWYWTASCTVAQSFAHWKGSMKFRFVINSCSFHRGRLKIVYEPTTGILPFDPYLNTNYTHIVDLADTDDFTICVGWGQPKMYRDVKRPDLSEPYALSNTLLGQEAETNGKLYVYVLNPLTSSSSEDTQLSVSVFTSMCDDVDFGVPSTRNLDFFTPFVLQSGIENGPNADPVSTYNPVGEPNDPGEIVQMSDNCMMDNSHLVYFGEAITSLRTLFKRYCRVTTESVIGFENTGVKFIRWRMIGIPGADSAGMHQTQLNDRFNYMRYSFVTFYRMCFAAYRGSVRVKIANVGAAGTANVRNIIVGGNTNENVTNVSFGGGTYSVMSQAVNSLFSTGGGGIFTTTFTKPVLDMELPFYVNRRFSAGRRATSYATRDENFFFGHLPQQYGNGAGISISYDIYHAGGEDFTCHYWMGPPILYEYVAPQPASTNPF